MYKDMKEFLKEEFKKEADEALQNVQNDPELRDLKAPDEIREKLFAELDKREAQNERRVLTEEEEKLIEIGRLYVRRQKRTKYLVVAAVLVLALAFGITAMGGPKKIVEDIRRKMMGRTQVEIDVDSKNIEPIEIVDEETGYQTIKDKWGVDAVRMQYYLEGTALKRFEYNELLKSAQFFYKKDGVNKIVYQITSNHKVASSGIDMEEPTLNEYEMTVQGQTINIRQYAIEGKDNSRWTIDFTYQNLQYFLLIEDETQSNMEKIVENLNFF